MNSVTNFDYTVEPHEPHWISRRAHPILVVSLILCETGLALAACYDHYWIAAALVLATSHVLHGLVICLHEASHGLLRKSRLLNEIDGVVAGIFSLSSFSLYRVAHQSHHAYLATERDEELWPFVNPEVPRGVRVLAAVLELTVGFLYTPLLFLRIFLRPGSPIRSKKVRRRIWIELGLMVLVWSAILTYDTYFHAWKYFLWMYFLPAWVAGNAQSLRKYVEHVGLMGSTVNSSTRSIIAEGWWANFLSVTLLHEPYHGVHHGRAGLTHAELPLHVGILEPKTSEEQPPYQNYGAAFRDLFASLPNPRVGAQWHRVTATAEESEELPSQVEA